MRTLTAMPSDSLYNRIVNTYLELGSVKQTSKECGASEVTVRRVLITEDLWSSRTSRKVAALSEQGRSIAEIAEILSVSEKAVEAYMPYSRGLYGESASEDSLHAKEYRTRVTEAQEGVRTLTGDLAEEKIRSEEAEREVPSKDKMTKEQASAQELISDSSLPINPSKKILRLHLELVSGFLYGADTDLDLDEEERRELFFLAKAEKGISRDILVPYDMNLHALHYAIQRLFGWQNSHLHNFSLSQSDFDLLTGGRMGPYTDLCGVLFRFPDDDFSDIYWDDNYDEKISVKSWLRKKYRAPFRSACIDDSLLGNDWNVDRFCDRFPEFDEDSSFKEIKDKVDMEEDFNCLVERLSVGELFLPESVPAGSLNDWKNKLQDRLISLEAELKEWGVNPDYGQAAAEELRKWRQSRDQLDKMKWEYPNNYRSRVRRMLGTSYEEALLNHDRMISSWEEECGSLIFDWNVPLDPYFHELYYLYDYGDDWCVKITAKEELSSHPAGVSWDGNAICVAADGLNLVDDCGGISGYLDMLCVIHGKDREEAESMRQWARGMGWTGRMSKPERML